MKDYSKYTANKSAIVAELLTEFFVMLDRITGKDYIVEQKNTSLHISKGSAFVGVHFLKDKLRLNIVLDHTMKSGLLHKSEQVSKNRFHNEVDIDSLDDLAKFEEFVKEAYLLKTNK